MSVVVEAIEGVVDFAGDVVQGVLDDPLTAIATAAAFSMGIPFLGLQSGALAAGVANTAAGLVQGEEFDEALKGGVMAGVTAWGGQQISNAFGSAADDAANIASKADDVGSNYSGKVQSTLDKPYNASSGYTGGTTAPSFDASQISGSGSSWSAQNAATGLGDDLLNVKGAGTGDWASVSAKTGLGDDALTAGGMQKVNYAAKNLSQYADDGAGAAGRSAPIEGAGTVTHKSSYTGTQNYVNVVDDAGNVGTNVKNFDVIKNTGGENLVTNPYPNISNEFNPLYSDANAAAKGWDYLTASKGEWDKIANAVTETGGKYLDETIDFAKTYPNTTALGVVGTGAAIKSMMDKKDDEEERLNKEQEQMQKEMAEANKTYDEPLPQYTLKRDVYTPYTEEQLYSYGEDPYGEGRFFSNSIYEPYTGYQEGGSVMPQAPSKINPAFAFYKYGNVPNSVRRYEGGGYAEGGSRGDGRSDHIEALLSPGEFVMDAETVSLLGNGSSEAGARRLEEMRQAIRKQKGGALSQGKFSPDAKSPLSYLKNKR